jgi:hypothetical protein
VRKKSTETGEESRAEWETIEAFARQGVQRLLQRVCAIKSTPEPDEFLNARDNRASSPARYKSRLPSLAKVVERTIRNT